MATKVKVKFRIAARAIREEAKSLQGLRGEEARQRIAADLGQIEIPDSAFAESEEWERVYGHPFVNRKVGGFWARIWRADDAPYGPHEGVDYYAIVG